MTDDRPITTLDDLTDEEATLMRRAVADAFLLVLARHGGQLDIPVAELDEFPKHRGAAVRAVDGITGTVLRFRLIEGPGATPAKPGGFVKPS
jgi:hypothetical protein